MLERKRLATIAQSTPPAASFEGRVQRWRDAKDDAPAPAPVPVTLPPLTSTVRPATEAEVKARDAAILARLKQGTATLEQLVDVIPAEHGQSPNDRIDECTRTVRRLGFKKVVKSTVQGWALA